MDSTRLTDLAAERLGGRVVHTNDEFFADASNLLSHAAPEWREGVYTERGKWMDGWESRRRREPGNDFCLIRLGAPGRVRSVSVATTFFRGNHPDACALAGIWAPGDPTAVELLARDDWFPLLERASLEGDSDHAFDSLTDAPATHVRFDIFPDGGVARLRLRGEVVVDWPAIARRGESVDVAALVNGGRVVAASDRAFGEPANLLLPGEPRNMGEGWETRRRRGPGHDWVVVALGHRAEVEAIEIDTRHFKGNYPAETAVDLADVATDEPKPDAGSDGPTRGAGMDAPPQEEAWRSVVARSPLGADANHVFGPLGDGVTATHARLAIYPDGGVARLRVIGRPVGES